MNTKNYKLANKKKFQVEYGFKGGKWNFRIGDFTLITKVPGGKVNADRIAEILRKSWFRHASIDGAARTAINAIVSGGNKGLAGYHGKWDHNWSWKDGGRSTADINATTVEMVPPSSRVGHGAVVEAEAENIQQLAEIV